MTAERRNAGDCPEFCLQSEHSAARPGLDRSEPGPTRIGSSALGDGAVTVTDMEQPETFSLTQLAAITGSGKVGLRAMIEAGNLVATRAESGRREWIVRREDAVAANFPMPAAGQLRSGAAIRKSGAADGIDAAMHGLLAELLDPIELHLARIESQSQRISAMVDDLTHNQGSCSRWWERFGKVGGRVLRTVRRTLG